MQLLLEINNKTKRSFGKAFCNAVAKKTIEESGFSEFFKNKKISLSIAVVDEEEIRKLNKAYRKKDSVTDVLSFSEHKSFSEIKKSKDTVVFLGELILCYNDIEKYAKGQKKKLQEELAEVVSHGVLHLMGMKHGKKMFAIQKRVAENKYR